jgi:hypothetical protein
MSAPVSVTQVMLRALALGLLLCSPAAFASHPIVKIFGVGQGYVVPPGERFSIQYRVTPEVAGNHSFYLDNSLVLVRNASQIERNPSGAYTISYPTGLAQDRLLELRICVDAAAAQVCDQVSIRAGHVLMPGQTVEISLIGVAGHVSPRTPFDIDYSILKPTVSDQLYYIDDVLRGRRTTSGPQSGPHTVRYPGGLDIGEKRLVRICVDEESATCGFAEVMGGQPPNGVDVPKPFSVANLPNHYRVVANCIPTCGYYSNVYYGDPDVSWMPERGDGLPDGLRMDLYYSAADGRLNPNAAPYTLIIYAHSAGSNKESLLTKNRTLLSHLLAIADSGAGVVIASADFRHPLKQLEHDLTPTSVADLSYLVQFARHHAGALNINPDDIFLVGTSLGAGVAVHAAVREIANPSDRSPVRRRSSAVRGVIIRDGQTSFAPHWFRSQFLEAPVAAIYQTGLLDDESRLIYGHAIADVHANSPLMKLLFTGRFIDHKVTRAEYLNRKVDLIHLPNYGLAMEAQYRLHGIEERIRVRDSYAGNFSRDAARFVAQNRLGH